MLKVNKVLTLGACVLTLGFAPAMGAELNGVSVDAQSVDALVMNKPSTSCTNCTKIKLKGLWQIGVYR